MVQVRFVVVAAAAATASAKFDVHVRRQLEVSRRASVVVEFDDTTPAIAAAEAHFESASVEAEVRGAKASLLRSNLIDHALRSQASVEPILNTHARLASFEHQQFFWIDNSRHIVDASEDLLNEIAALPNVRAIRKPVTAYLPIEPTYIVDDFSANVTGSVEAIEWGVNIIDAPKVWATGNKGKGIIVAGIDTGVRSTHEALRANWRQTYGWFDPAQKAPTPKDYHGHGSHTAGSSVGSNGIGVAPEASWIACVGCTASGCPESALTGCAQFVLCPTDVTGANPKCELRADVVNNSWGSTDGASTFYFDQIKAWRAAGIIPVFSNGNSGPSCSTVGAPGASPLVIGVGASSSNDGLASFSSRGPTPDKRLKPDVSAPGNQVRSAKPTGDSDYQLMSGTSMAAPHVTGAVALYLAAKPKASFDEVFAAFTKSADTSGLTVENKNCGGVADSGYPNNNYGHYPRPDPTKATPAPTTTKATPKPTTKPTTRKPTPKPTTKRPTTTKRPRFEGDEQSKEAEIAELEERLAELLGN